MHRPLYYLGVFFLAAAAVKGIFLLVALWKEDRRG